MGSLVSALVDACQDFGAFLNSGSGGHPSSIEIKGTKYRIDRIIGEGAFSYVYLATDRIGGSKVALKRFAIQDIDEQARLLEEVKIHRNLCPHDNIVMLLDSEVKSIPGKPLPEIWISMEYVSGPSLQVLVNSRMAQSKPISRAEVLSILCGAVSGLAHMHSQSPPISHWDVKLDNMLLGDDEKFKLCDFGSASRVFYLCNSAQEVTVAEAELSAKMTLMYRPPESLDLWRKQRVDTKADLWSLGVMVYVLLYQEMPFDENPLDVLVGRPKRFRGKPDSVFEMGSSDNGAPTRDTEDLLHLVMTGLLVCDPAARMDIFALAERLAVLVPLFTPPPRPRPGFVSAQKGRFSN